MKLLPAVIRAAALFALFAAPACFAQAPAQPAAPAASAPESECAALPALKEELHRQQETLSDWPNLVRYRDANAQLPTPSAQEKRVVFMGDSITDMWAEPRFGGFFPGKPYVDRGISGQTTPQMLIRFRPDVIALSPRAVVILAGTNDLAGNTGPETLADIENNLASMTELAQASKIKVILAALLPVSDYAPRPGADPNQMTRSRPPEKILELNTWIKQYAASHHAVYLDYFSALVDEHGFLKKELSDDGLHPNKAGYAVMAPLAEAAIRKAVH